MIGNNLKPSSSRGFTLIEVLAAFIVFTLIFATVLQLTTVSYRSVARSQEYTEAALWAESKLVELVHRETLSVGTESGEFNQRFRWELDVSPFSAEASLLELYSDDDSSRLEPWVTVMRVELKVFWLDDRHQQSFVTLVSREPGRG
ncbi:hypothetical protein SAMN04488073_3249 [Marinobacter gudaonensis]|uniref:General secretion pathway protein I n=1 Tax=Marinobacter gudaonensis TaxID=375760 RepID=A0A1I6HZU2_9GAMM|nr:prepilin-type N-terminal cleavage/methylation domain-containing protein [Marinobacter gudaonensis]SFR59986.1 hypothetical protein SAMN04488073_3249 [Marinobacter gudaonensis]